VANQQQELSKRFHISKRFQLSKRFFSCMSAFLFLHKRFHLIILCESALVYFSDYKSARYLLSFQNYHAAIISIS